jgi:hypothetical protein
MERRKIVLMVYQMMIHVIHQMMIHQMKDEQTEEILSM